jgi:hypothetical protein
VEHQEHFAQQVLATLDDSLNVYRNGSPSFFDYFPKDATVFSADSDQPVVGREAYRSKFEPFLTNNKRNEKVLDRTIQVVVI